MVVHVGVDVRPLGGSADTILWSKAELRNMMCGRNGEIYSALSLRDCGNLRAHARKDAARRLFDVADDLDPRLAGVIQRRANFFQMYNSSPHYRPQWDAYHAVSGLLAASMCVHPQVRNRMIITIIVTSKLQDPKSNI